MTTYSAALTGRTMHSEEGGCVDSAVQTDGKRKQSEVGEKEVVVSRTTSAATLPGKKRRAPYRTPEEWKKWTWWADSILRENHQMLKQDAYEQAAVKVGWGDYVMPDLNTFCKRFRTHITSVRQSALPLHGAAGGVVDEAEEKYFWEEGWLHLMFGTQDVDVWVDRTALMLLDFFAPFVGSDRVWAHCTSSVLSWQKNKYGVRELLPLSVEDPRNALNRNASRDDLHVQKPGVAYFTTGAEVQYDGSSLVKRILYSVVRHVMRHHPAAVRIDFDDRIKALLRTMSGGEDFVEHAEVRSCTLIDCVCVILAKVQAFQPGSRPIQAGGMKKGPRLQLTWATSEQRLPILPCPNGVKVGIVFVAQGEFLVADASGAVVLWDSIVAGQLESKG